MSTDKNPKAATTEKLSVTVLCSVYDTLAIYDSHVITIAVPPQTKFKDLIWQIEEHGIPGCEEWFLPLGISHKLELDGHPVESSQTFAQAGVRDGSNLFIGFELE